MRWVHRQVCSWGLSLFVLFEQAVRDQREEIGSWGLSLFVLFEPWAPGRQATRVLED